MSQHFYQLLFPEFVNIKRAIYVYQQILLIVVNDNLLIFSNSFAEQQQNSGPYRSSTCKLVRSFCRMKTCNNRSFHYSISGPVFYSLASNFYVLWQGLNETNNVFGHYGHSKSSYNGNIVFIGTIISTPKYHHKMLLGICRDQTTFRVCMRNLATLHQT